MKKDRLEKKEEIGCRKMRAFWQSGTPNATYPIKDVTHTKNASPDWLNVYYSQVNVFYGLAFSKSFRVH